MLRRFMIIILALSFAASPVAAVDAVADARGDVAYVLLIGGTEVPDPRPDAGRPSADIVGADVRPMGGDMQVAVRLADAVAEAGSLEQWYSFKFVIRGFHWVVEWNVASSGSHTATLCMEGGYFCQNVASSFATGPDGELTALVPLAAINAPPTGGFLGVVAKSRVIVTEFCIDDPCPLDVQQINRDSATRSILYY